MHLWGSLWYTARQRRQSRWHTAKPLKSQGGARYATTQERKRRSKAHGVHVCSRPVYLQAGEKGLPFFRLLKASKKFSWTEEANAAFT